METGIEQVQILLDQIKTIESGHPDHAHEIIPEGLRDECIALVKRSREVHLEFTNTVKARNTLNVSSVKMMKDFQQLHGDDVQRTPPG
jgi:hypothetical protein